MVGTPQDDPRKGRHRFVVNRGADQDQWCEVIADDYEVTAFGVHFVRGTDSDAEEVAFASHPAMVRRAEDVKEGAE